MKLNKFEEAYLKIISECNHKHIIKEDSSDGDFEAGKYYKGSCYLNYPNCEEELNYYENVLSEIPSINNKGIQVHFGEYESSPFGGQMKVTLFWKGDNFIGKTFNDVFNSAGSFGNDINDWYEDSENEIDGEITKEEYNTLFKNRLTLTKFKKWLKDVEKEINDDDDDDEYDEEFFKNIAIAQNPNTPKEVLIKFADSSTFGVRRDVAKNPNTPKEVLIKLANDSMWGVRKNVAENPNTPKEVLIKLANDKNDDVRKSVAENPNTPKEVLIKLANDSSWLIRRNVVENPNTPKEALIKLSNDEREWLREKAQMALNKNK